MSRLLIELSKWDTRTWWECSRSAHRRLRSSGFRTKSSPTVGGHFRRCTASLRWTDPNEEVDDNASTPAAKSSMFRLALSDLPCPLRDQWCP